jgi:FtsP/CotA-like multicopper oxidase with cupredoxin domain
VNGNLCVRNNDWEYWRVLLADVNALHKDLAFGPECEVMLLARHGVWRTVAPKPLTTNRIQLTAASRADFAVRCTADSTVSVDGQVVANIFADSSIPATGGVPYDAGNTWSVSRPAYLRDLSSGPAQVDQMWVGARRINGQLFDHHHPTYSWACDSGIRELDLTAGAHPFHIHVEHVQTFGCGGDYEDGERYDTVQGRCRVRFELQNSFTGPYIFHCHILEHEGRFRALGH